jgi:hypothetical protein
VGYMKHCRITNCVVPGSCCCAASFLL